MNAVVAFALKQRVLMVALMLFVFVAGIISFANLNIEAYPDPVPPRVEVITQNPGASAEEIERYITIPIEIQMTGIRHVRSIRTISLFGLSDVRIEFTYDYTYDEAEEKVIGRLSQLSGLPSGATPQYRRRARLARSIAIALSAHPDTRSPISRPSRTGSWNAASRRCLGSLM